ncbi:MAG: glycosyltransferase family 4 protein [Elusimicrobia bacterium]|nr:glycosyltransferase family 4 protein [Elusimicrobiota bacterium]
MKIRVVHLITKLEFGGAQQNTLYTVGHLDPERFEVHLACGPGAYLDSQVMELPRHVQTQWLRFLKREVRPWWDFLGFIELYFYLKRIKPDVIHTHSSKAGILGRWAAWLAGVPVIIHCVHGFGFHDFQNPAVRGALAWIERITARITTQLVYVSQTNLQYGAKWRIAAEKPAMVIRSGVDLAALDKLGENEWLQKRRELGIAPTEMVIATVGNLKPQKNPGHFIRLAQICWEQKIQARFLFVGGWEGDKAREQQILKNAPPNLKYLGWRQDAAKIIKAGNLFVLTSLWEGLPRSAVEALRLGVPVVAYASDGLNEIIEDGKNGFLAPQGNFEALSQQVLRLLKSPAMRDSMTLAARRSIGPEFDINNMVRRQEELYRQLTVRV